MKAKTADLRPDADRLLNALLLAFKEKLPFGSGFTDPEFLTAARSLMDAGALKIMQEADGSMRLGLLGRDF